LTLPRRVLVVAAHPDDETLGVGGTIAKHFDNGDTVKVLVVSGHLPPLYARADYDTTVKEAAKAFEILGVSESEFLEIPTGTIGSQPVGSVNGRITKVVEEFRPELVFCPFPDRHVDHRSVFESVMVATRPRGAGLGISLLAAYETLSETHWNAPQIEPNFVPSMVVDVTGQIQRKLSAIRCYASQIPEFPGARSADAVEALAKFRGTQAGFGFGEGFQIIRLSA
jgi:LmbE family N-acetylglucosaminyl deacetylase